MQKLDPKKKGKSKTVGVVLSDEQIEFIKMKGKISDVIRMLISNEIEKTKKIG